MTTLSYDKIKQHKNESIVHKQAEKQELLLSSQTQPNWHRTQQRQLDKHEQAVQNLMLSSIYLCQQDNSLNSIESLCVLLEKLGVSLLPAEVASVSYRNSKAAFCFLQHIADCLHQELVEKVKASPVCGTITTSIYVTGASFICLGWMSRLRGLPRNHASFMYDMLKITKPKHRIMVY